MNAEPRRQSMPDIGTDHSDDDVANDPHSIFRHELRGDPSGDEADQQNHGKVLIGLKQCGQMHAGLQPMLFSLCGARASKRKNRAPVHPPPTIAAMQFQGVAGASLKPSLTLRALTGS